MRVHGASAAGLFVGLFIPSLLAQTDLKPAGSEPCDQALRHVSSSVMGYLTELTTGNPAKQDSLAHHHAADYMDRVAVATEVIMHCETTGASAANLQDDLIQIYTLRPIGASRTAPYPTVSIRRPNGTPPSDMEITVDVSANDPRKRAILIVYGRQDDRATLRLLFAPSKTMITAISSDGRELPTNFPDGFVRVMP
jgi:hypothetical protein